MPSLFSRFKHKKSDSASSDKSSPATSPRSSSQNSRTAGLLSSPASGVVNGAQGAVGKATTGITGAATGVTGTVPVLASVPVVAVDGALDKSRTAIPDELRHRSPIKVNPARSAPPPPPPHGQSAQSTQLNQSAQSNGLVIGAQDTSQPIQNPFPVIPSAVEVLKPRPNVVNTSPTKQSSTRDSSTLPTNEAVPNSTSPYKTAFAHSKESVRDVEGRKLRPAVIPSHEHKSEEGAFGRASGEVLRDGNGTAKDLDPAQLPRRNESLQAETDGLSGGVAGLSLGDKAKDKATNGHASAAPTAVSTGTTAAHPSASSSTPALEAQRKDLHDRISKFARDREASQAKLTPEGVQAFHAAGIGHLADKKGSVNLYTKWLKPVVQEVIKPIVHTETFTIIERHLHIHHVYPKIQPISDPNPEVITTRHRIFSPQTGRWHEVVGDDAAREILGDDVFNNGPKEVRHIRRQAHEVSDEERYAGTSKAKSVASGGESDDDFGFNGQRGYARAVEREYKVGQEKPSWKSVPVGRLFGTHGGERDSVGVAL